MTKRQSRQLDPPMGRNKLAVLDWLPWEKVTIWGLFLLVVYVLRHFFFIIFMTFILAYIARSVISKITGIVSSDKERPWLERTLTVVFFGLVLFGLFNLGSYFGPQLIRQGEVLVSKMTRGVPDNAVVDIKTRIAGPFLFSLEYPTEGNEAYQADFRAFVEKGGGKFLFKYSTFGNLSTELEREFEIGIQDDVRATVESELADSHYSAENRFEVWFLTEKAPTIYLGNEKKYIDAWTTEILQALDEEGLDEFMKNPNAIKRRDMKIKKTILANLRQNEPDRIRSFQSEWKDQINKTRIIEYRKSTECAAQFEEFYLAERSKNPDRIPYDFEKYQGLRSAHKQGEDVFAETIEQMEPLSPEQREEQNRRDFELKCQRELTKTWFAENWFAIQIEKFATKYLSSQEFNNFVTNWVGDTLKFLLAFPIQLALSLLLSFFITFDIPKIRRGMRQLRVSRLSDFYAEIAPDLINFGRLMGRAFQAQGVIAFFNTVLTFVAIRIFGIQNEIFLCAIVFVCSFIPVLGVVISSIPIAAVALVQDDGTIFLSLKIVGAILVIHFIETSILNPKILGDMLHMHPVVILAVLAVGEHFFKIWGLLLGVPIAVYIIRIVILNQGVPGLIEPVGTAANLPVAPPPTGDQPPAGEAEPPIGTGDDDKNRSLVR